MRQLPHRSAKEFGFCLKCNQPHELPVGRFSQVLGQMSGNNMAETASNSSTSFIPLAQTTVESPPRPKSLSHVSNAGPPGKLDAILQHLKHLDEEIKEVKKSQQQGHTGESGQPSSPPRQGYVPPPCQMTKKQPQGLSIDIWGSDTQTSEEVVEDLV